MSIWKDYDHCGIKIPHPSGIHGLGRGFRGGHGSRGGLNRASCVSTKDREIDDLKKQLAEQSPHSINNINSSKEDDAGVSTKFAQANKKKKEWLPPPPPFLDN